MKDLSPREVARSLGVSESSVKRWVDDGVLSAQRTAGGHRRIPVAEAVRFVRRSGAAVVRPEVIFGTGMARAVAPYDPAASQEMGRRLHTLLQHDNAPAVRTLLLALYATGWPVAALCDGPIRVALEEIGSGTTVRRESSRSIGQRTPAFGCWPRSGRCSRPPQTMRRRLWAQHRAVTPTFSPR